MFSILSKKFDRTNKFYKNHYKCFSTTFVLQKVLIINVSLNKSYSLGIRAELCVLLLVVSKASKTMYYLSTCTTDCEKKCKIHKIKIGTCVGRKKKNCTDSNAVKA